MFHSDFCFLHSHLVEEGVRERANGDVVEECECRVELSAVEHKVGGCVELQHVVGAVFLHIVADEEGELHGVVGDEF